MTTSHALAGAPGPEPASGTTPARQAHLRSCAAEVTRLRGLFAPVSADRLALVSGAGSDGVSGGMSWTRLRRAAFLACDPSELDDRERHILTAIALDHSLERSPIFSHGTARDILGLPSIGHGTDLVDFASPPGDSGRSPQARRRRTSIAPTYETVGGLCVTDLDRTVIDCARHASLASALATADAALHQDLADQAALVALARALPKGARGCKLAELAVLLADHRSESPLESLSRARMFQLGIPMPELQVKFYDAAGFIGRVDFFWAKLGIIGEADGRMKFRVSDGLTGKEAEEAVWRAKRRDDRLRRHPEVRDVGHWDWREALDAGVFMGVLQNLGVSPVRDSGWPLPDGPLPRKSRAAR